jgi:hypothetical protein
MMNANVASTISLIQWLDPSDGQRETQDALAASASEVEIFFADVQTKAEVNEALAKSVCRAVQRQEAHDLAVSLLHFVRPHIAMDVQRCSDIASKQANQFGGADLRSEHRSVRFSKRDPL